MIYVVDTCVFRNIMRNIYRDVFPEVWESLEEMLESEQVISVREAYSELERQFHKESEEMLWFKKYKANFYTPSQREAEIVAEIYLVRNFQNGVAEKNILKGMPVADAFIVAKAIEVGGTVVTREIYKENAAKIPNICEKFGVDYISEKEFQTILRFHNVRGHNFA